MRDNYPYLKDPRVLAEIRRHKWIESQKAGLEIGFASAAVDWIKNYGPEWRRFHGDGRVGLESLIERRRYRRFKLHGVVQLSNEKVSLVAEPIDLSFQGMLCRTDQRMDLGSDVNTRLSFQLSHKRRSVNCSAKIERIVAVGDKRYDLFLSFSESGQEIIRNAFCA